MRIKQEKDREVAAKPKQRAVVMILLSQERNLEGILLSDTWQELKKIGTRRL